MIVVKVGGSLFEVNTAAAFLAFADTPADAQIGEVITLVSEAGGIDSARRRGEQFASEAEEALDGLPDTPARTALADAIPYVMDRRS